MDRGGAGGGDRLLADEHAEVWNGIVRLFEELEMVLGDFEATPRVCRRGGGRAQRLRIGRVLPGSTRLSLDRSNDHASRNWRSHPRRERGCASADPGEDALFADEGRALLDGAGLRLGPDGKMQLLHEQYFVYIALTRASRRLVVLYARADEDGRPRSPPRL